jgi:Ni/Co efflux regulator RcnB
MRTVSISLIALLCAALASPASADNDKNKGQGHGGGSKSEKSDNDHGRGNAGPNHEQRAAPGSIVVVPYQQIVVIDRDRDTVRTFYRTEYAAGRCPPGLAKKHNGCMPPGQAKKVWVIGQPLPPEVVYYPIQRELWTQLTPPPYGYEYVRVNDDIVLISTTTRVIGALLGNLANFGG